MNRRQKIIVSVVGIFLVLLILVGLTYAYFLTRIQGNTKSTSITVKTANLALVYGDGNGTIGSASNTIKPGDEIGSKTFTVKNEGNATTGYVVVIEDVVITDYSINKTNLEDENVGFKSNDFRYTLTCESDGEVCNGISDETVFPMKGGIVVGNNIEVGKTQTYTLTVVYKETGENQSDDMNKGLTAKVNIKDIKEINPYSDKTTSLAYNIINNAKLSKNGTELLAVPKTKVAERTSIFKTGEMFSGLNGEVVRTVYTSKVLEEEFIEETISQGYEIHYSDNLDNMCSGNVLTEVSSDIVGKYLCFDEQGIEMFLGIWFYGFYVEAYDVENDSYLLQYIFDNSKSEKTLSVAQDDYGTSYYYRGDIENNYVNFAGMCWRTVRIEGDGSIKLILEDQNTTCENASYTGNWKISDASTTTAYQDFQESKLSSVLDKLKVDNWCIGNTTSLKCDGTVITKYENDETDVYVATLSNSEIVYAGAIIGYDYSEDHNTEYYLVNDYQLNNENSVNWKTLNSYTVHYQGCVFSSSVTANALRPAVTLKAGTLIIGGDGTQENPYIVE